MGVNNRQRRKTKQKTRQQQQRVKNRVDELIYDAGQAAEAALSAALQAKAHGHKAELDDSLAALSDPRAAAIADVVVIERAQDEISEAWAKGWQPVDLLCAAARSISTHAQQLLLDMIAAELRQYARSTIDEAWERQLAIMGATAWWERDEHYFDACTARRSLSRVDAVAYTIDVLLFLARLPKLPQLCPPPGEARRGSLANVRSGGDRRTLERVRALLAKAEATTFPEEAETYTAKAQELMTRHSIDYAMLSAAKPGKHQPVGRRIPIENPYDAPKATLLDAIAKANRCHAVWSRDFGFSTIVGFTADLEVTELMFTSLLLQASVALQAAGSPRDGRTTSFRRSFLTAYANRIGQRLDEANRSAMHDASREYGGDLLPVLSSRAEAVKGAFEQLFPALRFHSVSAPTNRQGWIAGLAAADRAQLDQRRELERS